MPFNTQKQLTLTKKLMKAIQLLTQNATLYRHYNTFHYPKENDESFQLCQSKQHHSHQII